MNYMTKDLSKTLKYLLAKVSIVRATMMERTNKQ